MPPGQRQSHTPLMPLQPPRCWGPFSHLRGAQPPVLTHRPPLPAAPAHPSPCIPPAPHCPFSLALPSSCNQGSGSAPALPSVPVRADCYSGCVPPFASLRLFKKAHGAGLSHLPPRRAGESSPRRRAVLPGAAQPCPAVGSTRGRPQPLHRAVPRWGSCPGPALAGGLSGGEGTEPCRRSAPGVPQGFLWHPQRVCLSVWVSPSLSAPSWGAEQRRGPPCGPR